MFMPFLKTYQKSVASFVLICFSISFFTLPPEAWASLQAPGFPLEITPEGKDFSASFVPLGIPPEIASIEEVFIPDPKKSTAPPVIHIQSVHAHPETQKKIYALLKFLDEKYGIGSMFIEGAAEQLNPDFFHFFDENRLNVRVAEKLVEKGELTGAELFLVESHKKIPAYGIEDPSLYRENLTSFQTVMLQRPLTSQFTSETHSFLDRLETVLLTPETRKLLRSNESFDAGQLELLSYAHELERRTKSVSGLDLRNFENQLEWPQMIRLLRLQEVETGLDPEKIQSERERLVSFLREIKIEPLLVESFQNLAFSPFQSGMVYDPGFRPNDLPRYLAERLVAATREKGFSFDQYPYFTRYLEAAILQSELEAGRLFDEMERLFETLVRSVSKKEEELTFTGLVQKDRLFERLFDLELTPKDYAKIQTVNETPRPLVRFLLDMESLHEKTPLGKTKLVPDNIETLESVYGQAIRFYQLAKEREEKMADKILDAIATKQPPSSEIARGSAALADVSASSETPSRNDKKGVTILITGGFHTEGLSHTFRKKQVPYTIVSPRVTEKVSPEAYVSMLLGEKKTAFDTQYLEPAVKAISRAMRARMLSEEAITQEIKTVLQAVLESALEEKMPAGKTVNRVNNSPYANNRRFALQLSKSGDSAMIRMVGDFIRDGKRNYIVIPMDTVRVEFQVLAARSTPKTLKELAEEFDLPSRTETSSVSRKETEPLPPPAQPSAFPIRADVHGVHKIKMTVQSLGGKKYQVRIGDTKRRINLDQTNQKILDLYQRLYQRFMRELFFAALNFTPFRKGEAGLEIRYEKRKIKVLFTSYAIQNHPQVQQGILQLTNGQISRFPEGSSLTRDHLRVLAFLPAVLDETTRQEALKIFYENRLVGGRKVISGVLRTEDIKFLRDFSRAEMRKKEGGMREGIGKVTGGVSGSIVPGESRQPLPPGEQGLSPQQTSYASFLTRLSEKTIPTIKNAIVTATNEILAQISVILSKIPPSAPAIRNAWNRVREDFESASSRLFVQNVLGVIANYVSNYFTIVNKQMAGPFETFEVSRDGEDIDIKPVARRAETRNSTEKAEGPQRLGEILPAVLEIRKPSMMDKVRLGRVLGNPENRWNLARSIRWLIERYGKRENVRDLEKVNIILNLLATSLEREGFDAAQFIEQAEARDSSLRVQLDSLDHVVRSFGPRDSVRKENEYRFIDKSFLAILPNPVPPRSKARDQLVTPKNRLEEIINEAKGVKHFSAPGAEFVVGQIPAGAFGGQLPGVAPLAFPAITQAFQGRPQTDPAMALFVAHAVMHDLMDILFLEPTYDPIVAKSFLEALKIGVQETGGLDLRIATLIKEVFPQRSRLGALVAKNSDEPGGQVLVLDHLPNEFELLNVVSPARLNKNAFLEIAFTPKVAMDEKTRQEFKSQVRRLVPEGRVEILHYETRAALSKALLKGELGRRFLQRISKVTQVPPFDSYRFAEQYVVVNLPETEKAAIQELDPTVQAVLYALDRKNPNFASELAAVSLIGEMLARRVLPEDQKRKYRTSTGRYRVSEDNLEEFMASMQAFADGLHKMLAAA